MSGLHAEGKPGAYAIVDISEISDADTFKTLIPKTGPANAAFGGQFVAVTEDVVALEGIPPKRFVIVSFDSIDKVKAWYHSPAQEEVNAIRNKSAKSRVFAVDGKLP